MENNNVSRTLDNSSVTTLITQFKRVIELLEELDKILDNNEVMHPVCQRLFRQPQIQT